MKYCPSCTKEIQDNDIQCRYCKIILNPDKFYHLKTRKCPFCQEYIHINALKCSHCQEFLNNKKVKSYVGLLLSIFLILLIYLIFNSNSKEYSQIESLSNIETNRVEICTVIETYIKESIKAPKTASFQPCGDLIIHDDGDNIFFISSYVDSQNSFGAYLRTKFIIKIQKISDYKWKLIDLNFE